MPGRINRLDSQMIICGSRALFILLDEKLSINDKIYDRDQLMFMGDKDS